MDTVVRIKDLAIEFATEVGVTDAVRGISLDIERGKTTAIVGESGSGKSVTALALMRLIQSPGKITRGQIQFTPQDSSTYDVLQLAENSEALFAHRGGKISMVFQEPMSALSPVHTIGDQVTEALLTHQKIPYQQAESIAATMLQRVGIDNAPERLNQYPFEFSGGMRQRVCIAMAIINEPEMIICDEPTTALDVTVQAEILELIQELKANLDMSVVFITHDLAVVAQTADNVAVMHRGRLLEFGSVRQVLKDPAHPYTKALLQAVPGSAPGTRLTTVEDLIDSDTLAQDFPLIEIANGRLVALPMEQIAAGDKL